MATSTVTNTYAKYAPKNTKQQVNWAKLAYNDPYFSLGYMAGSTLADNYNKRGEQKILENAAASLNGFEPTVTPEQQAQAPGPDFHRRRFHSQCSADCPLAG